jgi:hypothetical protein
VTGAAGFVQRATVSVMATLSLSRPNAREIAVGTAIAVAVSIAASTCVLLFHLHPAWMISTMILGMGLGHLQSRRMMSDRLARVRDQKRALRMSSR